MGFRRILAVACAVGCLSTSVALASPLHDTKLRRRFAKATPEQQLALLPQFRDPWNALAAALTRPTFAARLQQTPLLVQRVSVREVSGLDGWIFRQHDSRENTLFLSGDGTVAVETQPYAIIHSMGVRSLHNRETTRHQVGAGWAKGLRGWRARRQLAASFPSLTTQLVTELVRDVEAGALKRPRDPGIEAILNGTAR